MRILMVLLKKEFILFWNNKFIPKVAFIFPCMVILVIPLVTTMDVRHVGVAVVDDDNSRLSRDVTSDLSSNSFFTVTMFTSYETALRGVERGDCDVILEIPFGFQKSFGNGNPSMPHLSANGVNGIKGSLGSRYVSESVMQTLVRQSGDCVPLPVTVEYLYNPTLEYRNNMIPALMIMLLVMICGFLPALNLVGEKESGTIEQINVSPVSTKIFVLSKILPYCIIGLIDLSLAMLIAALVYGLCPAGAIINIYFAAVLFIFVISGLGVVIANYSSTMSQSMFLMFFIILIFVLMSGLLTPISSMPRWAQYITYVFPPRYFIEIMRSVYLKATGMSALSMQFLALGGFAILTNLLAAITYRKQC